MQTSPHPATARDKSVALNYLWQRLRDEFSPDLWGWSLVIDTRSKRRLGQCRYRQQEIGISQWILRACEWDKIEDTLRHEIAHALVGPGHKHGRVWKAMAVRCGADPTATTRLTDEENRRAPKTAAERGQHKWAGYCAEGCEQRGKWRKARLIQRNRNRYSCPKCKARIVWVERYGR